MSISVAAVRLDVLEHRRVVRAAALRREHVHLPRILAELDARSGRDGFALVHQVAERDARGRPGASSAAKCGSCGSPVSAATVLTVALKISFDHCAGRRSSNASAFSPEDDDQLGDARRRPRGVVPRAGPIHVAVSSTYSTCVSAWRVPLMNVTRGEQRPVAVRADDLVGADPVLHGHQRRVRPVALRAARRLRRGRCPCRRRSRARAPAARRGSVAAVTRPTKSARPLTRRPCLVERARVLLAARRAPRPRRPARGGAAKRLPITPAPATQTRVTPRPRRRRGKLAAAGQPGRPQDQDDRHQRRRRRSRASRPAGRCASRRPTCRSRRRRARSRAR